MMIVDPRQLSISMDNGQIANGVSNYVWPKISLMIMWKILPFIWTLKSFGKKSYNFRIFIGEFVSESGEVDWSH